MIKVFGQILTVMNLFCFKLNQALQIDIKINISINNVVKFEVTFFVQYFGDQYQPVITKTY